MASANSAGAGRRRQRGGACLRTFVGNPRPPFCCVVHRSQSLKGLVSCFPADGFTLHLHTEITHSICENHLLEQTCLLVLMQLEPCNYALATHASSVYQTRVWQPEILRLLTHRIHVMSSSRPSLTLLRIWCSSGFYAACPNASFDIQSWNSPMMPTITWGRFTGSGQERHALHRSCQRRENPWSYRLSEKFLLLSLIVSTARYHLEFSVKILNPDDVDK